MALFFFFRPYNKNQRQSPDLLKTAELFIYSHSHGINGNFDNCFSFKYMHIIMRIQILEACKRNAEVLNFLSSSPKCSAEEGDSSRQEQVKGPIVGFAHGQWARRKNLRSPFPCFPPSFWPSKTHYKVCYYKPLRNFATTWRSWTGPRSWVELSVPVQMLLRQQEMKIFSLKFHAG